MSDREKNSAEQARKFTAAAKQLGCDESEDAFNAKLKKVAGTKVESTPRRKPQKRPT